MEPSLLVVEDSKSFASLLIKSITAKLGLPVVLATSFAEAKTKVATADSPFLLAILDLYIPGGADGDIADFALSQGIPSIVLTGMYKKELQDRILAKGILDYFVKDNIGVIDSVIHFIKRFQKNGQIKIMVADDSRSARSVLSSFLRRYGFSVIEAEDGQAALNLIEASKIHLVITDYEMPYMNGIQLLKRIRALYGRDEMAVIGISSHVDDDLSVRFIKAGANDFLVKPFKNEEILCRVSQNIEIIDRHRELERLLKRHRSVLENALDAIITSDHEGKIIDFNPAAENLFGFTREAVLGRRIADHIIPPTLQAKHQTALESYVLSSHPGSALKKRFELPGLRANGDVVDLQVALTAVHQDSECTFTAFLQDITDRKQLLKSLEETLATAESANRAKSEFIANMSHEIRTPMNAVMGFTDLALKNELTPKIRDYLEKVETSSRSLMGIINDILDFSKIEAGHLELDPVRFDINDLFDRLADLFSKQVADRGIELILLPPATYNSVLLGDALRLEQVLINLIRNAVKFTQKGTIVVHATVEEKVNQDVQLAFSIQDTGIGIDPDRLPQLFEPFVQADGSTTRRFGGTGLGLTICKRLVHKMGGHITAISTPGQGSTFTFSVIVRFDSKNRRKPLALADDLSGKKVLLIDDNAFVRNILHTLIASLSLKPVVVATYEEALAELLEHNFGKEPFDLLLIDWDMPQNDGIALAKKILANLNATTPAAIIPKLILLTAFGREDIQQLAQESGINTFLDKPVTRTRLIKAINAAIGLPTAPQNDRRATQVLAQDNETANKIGGARILLVEDNVINQQIAKELLERVGLIVDIANNGKEAVAKVQRFQYEAVIMDLQMPVMDGCEATQKIREDSRFDKLPIIAMTAHALENERKRCLEVGMNAHLAKPIRPERLYGVLSKYIGTIKPVPMLAPFLGEGVVLPEIPGINTKEGLERVGNNLKLYLKLLARFFHDQREIGAELQNALNSGNRFEAAQMAHTIIGVAGNIGANGLRQAAEHIEVALTAETTDMTSWRQANDAFIAELDPILAALQKLDSSSSPPAELVATKVMIDKDKVVPAITALAEHLANNSIEVESWIEILQENLHDTPARATLDRMILQIEDYNFEEAIQALQQITADLGSVATGNQA